MRKIRRAALYSRYSTDQQRRESIEDQQRTCQSAIEAHGLTIVARFADPEKSGGTARRDGYQAMLAAARRGEFEYIVGEDVSRFWRNRRDYGNTSTEWEDLGVNLLTTCGCDTQREGWMVVTLKVGLAEDERKRIARRTRRGLEGKAARKEFIGGRPYGYHVNDPKQNDLGKSVIQIDAEQAKWVRWIFERYAEGQSALTIAHELNAQAVPSPGSTWKREVRRSKSWLASAISGDPARGIGILNNEKYIGRMVWRRTTVKRSSQDSDDVTVSMTPEAGVSHWQDESLRIVPQELWDRVKARQRHRSETLGAPIRKKLLEQKNAATVRGPNERAGAGRGPKHLCSGLLKCDECEANFVMTSGVAYACSTYRYGGPSACPNSITVQRVAAERAMLAAPEKQLLPHVESVKREAMRLWGQKAAGVDATEVQRLREELATVNAEIANLVDALATGTLAASSALAQALSARETERARLEQALAVAQAMRGKVTQMIPNLEGRIRSAIRDVRELAQGRDAMSIARAREMLRQFYGGPVRVRAEERDGKRVPVAIGSVPAFALLAVAGERRANEKYGSGGRI